MTCIALTLLCNRIEVDVAEMICGIAPRGRDNSYFGKIIGLDIRALDTITLDPGLVAGLPVECDRISIGMCFKVSQQFCEAKRNAGSCGQYE